MFWQRRDDADFSDEVNAHLELEADRLVQEEGLTREEALHAAHRAFGNVVNHQERFYRSLRWIWLDHLIRDVRYAFRSLRRDFGLVVFATLIVGLGIGATVTVFSVTNALLLRPLPFDEPERLVLISNGDWGRGQELSSVTVQVNQLIELRNESRTFTDVGGYHQFDRVGDHTLMGSGTPERINRLRVTPNFFQVLGVEPAIGRLFSIEESQYGGPPAVLLTHGMWIRHFAADSAIVGHAITIDQAPASVIGVLPASFDFASTLQPGRRIDYVAPFPLSPETNQNGNTLSLIGRLAPGATIEAAEAESAMLAVRVKPDTRNEFAPRLRPLHDHVSGRFRPVMLVLAGAVGLVMLIVCVNLSNLLLVRSATREKEIAVRAALGATRQRLVRQMLTESLVLTSAGAVLGWVLAIVGTRVLVELGAGIPLLNTVRVDGRALGFTVAIAGTTGLVLGMLPALRLSALAFHETLKEGSRSASAGKRHRLIRGALVVSEVALACVLLAGAGLLLRSFAKLADVELGFQPEHAVTVRIDPTVRFEPRELGVAYYDEALRQLRAAPGLTSVGLTDVLPTAFNRRWCLRDVGDTYCEVAPFVRVVSDGYLEAMGLTLIRGRDFDTRDQRSATMRTIINEAVADAVWPGESPLGRTVLISGTEWEVIGVVKAMRHLSPDQAPGPEVFFSMRQTRDFRAVHLIARGEGSVELITSSIRSTLAAFDPNLPVTDFRVVQDIIDASVSPRRFLMLLLSGFAVFALVLASLGIYGVISYSVSQRKQEIGIRMALGARASALQRSVLGETLQLAAFGTAIGLVAAFALARLMESLLFGVTASDFTTFAAVPVLLLAATLLAGFVPARRASQVNPTEALNLE